MLFAWAQDEGEGAFIYGITWLGNYLWGLAPDDQESQVETDRALFKHVYEKYDKYFADSKIKDINFDIEDFKSWSVRKASHRGIAKKVFKGVKDNNTKFSLHNEGIYFEDYTLEDKAYKVAVYSKIEAVSLSQDIRIKSFSELRNNTSIKVGYTSDYGLIAFYNADGKIQMLLQIIGGNTPKEAVTQWVNYLGLVLPSEEQQEEDKENSIQEMLKSVRLYALEKLNEIWGEKDESQEETAIDVALTEMEEFLGNSYAYGGGDSRTTLDEKGTSEMDCSEFMSRFLQKLGLFESVPLIFTSTLSDDKAFGKTEYGQKLKFISGSYEEDFIPKPGDIFVWSRSASDGHTGVVVSYNPDNDQVTIIEAIGITSPCSAEQNSLNSNRGCGKVVKSIYTRTGKALFSHAGWVGYYRPEIK